MSRLKLGDLVMRKYDLTISHTKLGFVVDRDTNGYYSIKWGQNPLEHFWDEYDLVCVSEDQHHEISCNKT